jgi:anti-sigma-K factor RskA
MSDDLHALVAAYALDALDPTESAAFEEHLASCELCVEELRGMRETTAALGDAVAETPPDALRARVLEQASRMPQTDREPVSSVVDISEVRSRRRGVNSVLAGVAAAAVIVAGALGVSTYQANQRADDLQVVAGQLSALLADPEASVERTQVTGGGTGTLIVSPSREEAVFLTSSLPETDPGQTYQLWAIDEVGATSVGLLEPDAGRATELVDLPPGTTTFGMSIEPAGGSPAPTTEPVLVVELST